MPGQCQAPSDRPIIVRRKLTTDQCSAMIRPVSHKKIKCAMFSTDSKKAPGLNGFGAGTFKQNWDIVGHDIIEAVRSFFINKKLLKSWNSTTISLIPKVIPATIRDFRPIACCNVVYKCISKVLV